MQNNQDRGEATPRPRRTAQATGTSRRQAGARPSTAAHVAGRKSAGSRQTAPRGRRHARRRAAGLSGFLSTLQRLTGSPRGIAIIAGGVVVLILLIAAIAAVTGLNGRDAASQPVASLNAVQTEASAGDGEAFTQVQFPSMNSATEAEAAPATQSTTSFHMMPTGDTWRLGEYAPEPQGSGYLPVFRRADREDKVVAVTVDDCFQTENLQKIIKMAEYVEGKLTIFPIGELLKRGDLQEVIKYAYEKGFEIENHTWSHDKLYNLTAEELAERIFNQDRALDYVLGINYKTHFLRPRGGDDRNDLRTHTYISQLGYYGIAHWSSAGEETVDRLKAELHPGSVYLFHCTDMDVTKLKEFIPYAVKQGYRLVTMNELFGYPENEVEPLTDDPLKREIIQLAPYQRDYKTLQATVYDYAAYEVQQALIAQGFLQGVPDGVYGPDTAACAARWQAANGYEGDGVLTPEQQQKLLNQS